MPRLRRSDNKHDRIQRHTQGVGMKRIHRILKRFYSESDGLEGVEFSVLTAVIIGTVVVVLTIMMIAVNGTFSDTTLIVGTIG